MEGQSAVSDGGLAAELELREAKKVMRKQLKQRLKGITVEDMHRQSKDQHLTPDCLGRCHVHDQQKLLACQC